MTCKQFDNLPIDTLLFASYDPNDRFFLIKKVSYRTVVVLDSSIDSLIGRLCTLYDTRGCIDVTADFKTHINHSNDCQHDWIFYTGLTEQFEYCIKCNKKKVRV